MITIPDGAGVRFCWCPPMQDPDDPAQHEAACAHAAFVERLRDMAPGAAHGRCYEASFGWVHVKPGCHCTR